MPRDDEPFPVSYPLSFLARAAALSALSCALGLWVLWWFFSRDLGAEYGPAFYTLKSLLGFLVPALVFCALVVLLVASVAVFVVAVFASHKVAGPLFRLQRVGDHLGRRVLIGSIHLRGGDQGKNVAEAINEWVKTRKEHLTSFHSRVEAFDVALRKCEEAAADRKSPAFAEHLAALSQRAEELQQN